MHLIEAVNRYSSDAMVVLTPNDQLQNTSYRVSEHNLMIICQELSKGHKILQKMKPRSRVLFKQQLQQYQEQENSPDELSSTLDRIARECEPEETKDEHDEAGSKDKQLVGEVCWTALFKRLRFFARYEHFIKLDILCQTSEDYLKWKSYVDKKMKDLCDMLFNDFREQLLELRIHPRPFIREETRDD